MSGLRAGAGRAEVRFPAATWPLDGFSTQHDPLFTRVLVLESDVRVVWAVVDQTSLADEPLDEVRRRISRVTGAPEASVIVSVSHTFSAPHLASGGSGSAEPALRNRLARDAVMDAVEAAAAQAASALQPASAGAGRAVCDVNVCRDVQLDAGWTLGVSEEGCSDKTLIVVRIDGEHGAPLAYLVNYAVQPSIMNESVNADGARTVTGDLAGAAMRRLESTHPGAVALFLIGAAGDQAPALTAVRADHGAPGGRRDAGDEGFVIVDLLGERLGAAAERIAAGIRSVDADPALSLEAGAITVPGQTPMPRERIGPTRSHVFAVAEDRELPYWMLRLGDTVVVGVQPELSSAIGTRIREASPFGATIVATMVNGGAKYLPDAGAFDRFTYEALSSRFAQGSAELLAAHLEQTLLRVHGSDRGARS